MAFDPVSLGIGATMSGISNLNKLLLGFKQGKLANKINPQYQLYQGSAATGQNLSTAQNAYNGRMGGAVAAEDKILQGQNNVINNAARGATDASQLLSIAQGSQNQTNDALVGLQAQEAKQKAGLLDNLQAAYGAKVRDDMAINESFNNKFSIDANAKAALRGSSINNKQGSISDAGNLALLFGQLKGGGASSGLGGGGDDIDKVLAKILGK